MLYAENGLIKNSGSLGPQHKASRAEAAELIMKFAQLGEFE